MSITAETAKAHAHDPAVYVVEPKPALQLNLRISKILRFSMIW